MTNLFEETISGGWAWSHILKKGTSLRVTDLEGGGSGALTFYNPKDLSERYNMPDTLKGQYTAFLTKGHALYSDMGRIQLSIIEDTFGGHDPLTGVISQEELESRFGVKSYQDHRNGWYQSGLNQIWTEVGKYGLDQRDVSSVLNLFAHISVSALGELSFDATKSLPGNSILLQAEMDTLVVLAATQHPLDPRLEWAPKPLKIAIHHTPVSMEKNPAWAYSEQNKRGFANTFLYNL